MMIWMIIGLSEAVVVRVRARARVAMAKLAKEREMTLGRTMKRLLLREDNIFY
jgi:hypothetical protein